MAWLRTGDNVANHPIVLAVLEHHEADDQSVNETFGFIMRCALQSAAHFTDYVISYGTALALAGSKAHADRLLTLATLGRVHHPRRDRRWETRVQADRGC